MIKINPVFVSPRGGSITCFRGDTGRIFRSCSRSRCVYSGDLHSAKAYLDNLEGKSKLLVGKPSNIPPQRKTTLKWNSDGELSAVDMARILDHLTNSALSQCDFAWNIDDSLSDKTILRNTPIDHLPASSWLP